MPFAIKGFDIESCSFTHGPFWNREEPQLEVDNSNAWCAANCDHDCECDTEWVEEISVEEAQDLGMRRLSYDYPGITFRLTGDAIQPVSMVWSHPVKNVPLISEINKRLGLQLTGG